VDRFLSLVIGHWSLVIARSSVTRPFAATALLMGVASLLLLTGCLNLKPAPDETRNFLLTPVAAESADDGSGVSVGLAPVQLPAYTSTSWIAVHTRPNEIQYSETARWAEPLNENVQRVLGANLRHQPGIGAVFLNTWPNAAVQQELRLQVQTVELRENGAVLLVAQWTRSGPQGSDVTSTHTARIERTGPRPSEDMPGAVAALSEALAELSSRVAQTLLPGNP